MSELLQETAASTTGDSALIATAAVSDDELIAHIISSHGDIELASERAKLSTTTLLSRLPSLDRTKLIEGIKTALTIQTFESFTQVKTITMASLADMSATQISKFMLELANQLSGLVAPNAPVQSGVQSGISLNIINQMNNEAVDAKQELIKRISVIDVDRAEDRPDRELDDGAAAGALVRLGGDGEAGAEGTLAPERERVVDLVYPNGSRLGKDQDWSGNSA